VELRGGLDEERKKTHCCLCQESNPARPARSLVTILTELPRLHYESRFIKNVEFNRFSTLSVLAYSNEKNHPRCTGYRMKHRTPK